VLNGLWKAENIGKFTELLLAFEPDGLLEAENIGKAPRQHTAAPFPALAGYRRAEQNSADWLLLSSKCTAGNGKRN
jgi:hypothetical protein